MEAALKITVKLTPRASSNRIGSIQKTLDGVDHITAYVTAPPEDGKANEALIKLLAKHYKVAQSSIKIIKGLTNRNKLLVLDA